jgi:hypothetical protein
MLGYEVDFGYVEALALASSDNFSEKQIVCEACSWILLYFNQEAEIN